MSAHPTRAEDERRPTTVLLISTWDIAQATLASIGAMLSFGTGETIRGRALDVPVWEQLLNATSFAALAGVFILLAVLMARRQRSIRRAQIAVLLMHALLQLLIGVVAWVNRTPGDDSLALQVVYRGVFYALVDLAAAFACTAPRVCDWFREGGGVPRLLRAPAVLWVATALTLLVTDVVRGLQ